MGFDVPARTKLGREFLIFLLGSTLSSHPKNGAFPFKESLDTIDRRPLGRPENLRLSQKETSMSGGRGVIIDVLVQPRSSQDEVLGMDSAGWLRVRVAAPPVEGAANKRLIELLARHFGVPKGNVTILTGAKGRRKRVRISGDSRAIRVMLHPDQ